MAFSLSSARPSVLSRQQTPSRLVPVWVYFRVWAERRALGQLPAARLRDLGLSPEIVDREVHRPFWDLPDREDL